MASALFGASNVRSKNLVEFKAGRMNLKGKMVQPDKRKGLVYVYQSEDSLMHFCWKDRTTGIVEDDLMIFPDDVEIKRVNQCTTGRVYLMKFKSSNKKLFFWMQETDKEKDEKLWKKVNDSLNNPPAPGSASSSATSAADRTASLANVLGADFGGLEGTDLQNLIGSMSEQQLQMFLGGFMPVNSPSSNRSGSSSLSSNQTSRAQSTTSASRAEATPSTTANVPGSATTTTNQQETAPSQASEATKSSTEPKMQFSEFQNILGTLAQGGSRAELDLADIISLDVMAPILANKSIQEKLVQHLPESDILPKNEQELRATLTAPQFKKAMSSFGSALQSGQLGPLLQQFNLPENVQSAAAQGNLEAFAKAMEEYALAKKQKDLKKEEDDDKMES